jgi:hypothetical protein
MSQSQIQAEKNQKGAPNEWASPESVRLSDILLQYIDGRRWTVFAIIAAAYLLGFNGQWQIEPDGGLYLTLGRNLALGHGYTFRGVPHSMVYPGLPYALAGLYAVFGRHVIFAADVFILLCAVAALALTYRLVLLAYDRPTAVVVTLGVALAHEFFRYAGEILTDMPFLAGVMALLAAHEAIFISRRGKWWDWLILIAGLVVVVSTRPTMIGLLAAWLAALIWCAIFRRNLIATGVVVIVCLVAAIAFYRLDSGHFGFYQRYAIDQLSRDVSANSNAVIANARDLFGLTAARSVFGMPLGTRWLNAIFGSIVMLCGIALFRKRLLWGLWTTLTILMMLLLISNDRYLLQILPLLVLGWWRFIRAINLRLGSAIGNWLFAILLVIGMAPNIIQVINVVIHQHAHPFLSDYRDGKYQPFAPMAARLPQYTTDQDVIVCPLKLSRVMTFLSGRNVYEQNEPIHARSAHLLVIVDPADEDYSRWLRTEGIFPDGPPLVWIGRNDRRPGIALFRAHLAP